MEEEWKWVKGYEGLYQISNLGNVKSFVKNKKGRNTSLVNKNNWYLSFGVSDREGHRKTLRVHIEVAKAFIGDIPKGYHVHHKDGNKQNNTVDNLEIIHPAKHWKETEKKSPNIILGMNNYNRYERPKRIRQYTMDGIFLAEYVNSEVAGRMTGICQRNILQVASKTAFNEKGSVRKQAGGYIWKFAE